MVMGIGTDLIEIARVKKATENLPRFLEKIFTNEEILYCQGKKNAALHLAARFAAKEAFFKALGRRVGWKDVGIRNLPSGQPELIPAPGKEFGFTRAHVSLTHIREYAQAVVVLEKD